MSKLYMGTVDRKDPTFCIAASDMKHHMFVTGQSGCGKSSLVGRLVEEIILRDAGHVLLLDCNFEFQRFSEVDPSGFDKAYNRYNCPEDDRDTFTGAWDAKRPGVRAIKADEINILYPDIDTYLKAPLLGIDRDQHPGAYWLLQLIDERGFKKSITSKDGLWEMVPDIGRWLEGRVTRDEAKDLGSIIHEIRRNLSALELTRFANAAKSLRKQRYVNFRSPAGKKTVDEKLVKEVFGATCFCSIDLLSFPYEYYHFRDFVVLHLLHCVWKEAKNRFISRKINGGPDTSPLFIVIDEAHNLAPSNYNSTQSSSAQEVARIIRTIAAEGRKFGLFLILISQRADKIDDNVLSECDNFILMKSTPQTIERLVKYMPIDPKDQRTAMDAASFAAGQAFYCGAFIVDRKLVKVDGDIKRTL